MPTDPGVGPSVPSTRLHPIYLLTETARTVRRAIPFLVVTVLGGAPWGVNVALFALIMAVAVAEWSVRRYAVTAGLFQVSGGLLNRSVRTVPMSRITAVAANRSLTQRLVGTWTLRIGVPGDRGGALVTLPSLSTRRMVELRTALTGHRPAVVPGRVPFRHPAARQTDRRWPDVDAPAGPAPVLVTRLPTRTLLVAAGTSALIPVLVIAANVGWVWFSAFVPAVPRTFIESTVEPRGQLAVGALLVVVGLVAAVGWTVSRQYGFTVHRDGDLLHTSGGLVFHRAGTMPVQRVHAVRIVEGLWRGRLGYCTLQAEVGGMGRINPLRRTVLPLLRIGDAAPFVQQTMPELGWASGPLHPVPPELRRRYLFVPTAWGLGLGATTTVGLLLAGAGVHAVAAMVLLPLGCWLGRSRARTAAWSLDERVLVLRWRRILTRQTVVVRRGGIQLAQAHASILNSRRGVDGISVRFSSRRSATVAYLPAEVVHTLLTAVHPGKPRPVDAYRGR